MTTPAPRTVLLTGATGGIGAAAARLLARQGLTVLAGVRTAADAARLADPEAGIRPVLLDVTDPESIAGAVADAAAVSGPAGLHALVNNAGLIIQGPVELVPEEQLRLQLDVNTLGPAALVRAALPLLRRGGGRIVNVSAPTGRVAIPFLGPLSASKAALESLTAALRVELRPWDIPVVLVVPGATGTEIFAKAAAAQEKALAAQPEERARLYERQLAAVAAASARTKQGSADQVAAAIARAVTARRPRARYYAGPGTTAARVAAHLPDNLRDRLLTSALRLPR